MGRNNQYFSLGIKKAYHTHLGGYETRELNLLVSVDKQLKQQCEPLTTKNNQSQQRDYVACITFTFELHPLSKSRGLLRMTWISCIDL